MVVLLPISVSAQYTTYSGTGPNEFFSQESDAAAINQDVSAQGCNSGYYPCGTNCWKCSSSSDVFTCYNSQPYCCPGGYPIYCAKTNGCWKSAVACNNAQKCGNEDWTACLNPDYPNWNCKPDGQSTCCISGKPYYWNGDCHECPQDKPNKCGSTCYSGNECGSKVTVCDKNNNVVCCPSDFPSYCARTDSCWKNADECANAQKCGSEDWSVCRNPDYPNWNCKPDGQSTCCISGKPYYWNGDCHECPQDKPNKCGSTCYGDEYCETGTISCENGNLACEQCPNEAPYYCARTDSCWPDKEKCDSAIKCNNEWQACNYAAYDEKCVDNQIGCCLPEYPYFCPSSNTCFKQDGFCDGRPIYNCEGKLWVCITKDYAGSCSGNELRCCPPDHPYWWESDKQCHSSPHQQKTCAIPDGSSAECDCNRHSDCPASYPYCEEEYPAPVSDGYDKCLASPPEYCGNGRCDNGENYNNCAQDCTAPKGKIIVDVSQTGKPVSGAYVYLDSTPKGSTDSNGKASFEADYGSRSVKVECPDKKFCGSKTIRVDGTEFASFACNCNLLEDSDGDGNSDEDEKLLGTDINDPNDNFNTAFSPFSHPQSCMDVLGILSIIWNNRDDLIQANEMAINALNTTTVMTANLQENPGIVAQTLAKSGISGELEKTGLTLAQALESSEDVDGFFTENGALLVMTDYETSSTTIIAISATCVGTFIGSIYGAGTGIKDDVVAIVDVIKGVWYLATADDEKIASDVKEFIKAIPQLFGKAGELFHEMIITILGKGQRIIQKTGLFKSDKTAYLQFQIGFTNGFITGYVVEQIAAMFVGAGAILKALKAGKMAELLGKTAKLPALLAKITDNFGGEVASVVKKLKYAEKIVQWTEEEQNALAELIKLGKSKNVKNVESWLDDAGEAGAKHASGRISSVRKANKLSDDQLAELMNTNLGRQTLKAADATDDLIVKQSRFVEKWGASEVDRVTKKHWWSAYDAERVEGLKRLLDVVPYEKVTELTTDRAAMLISDNRLTIALKELKGTEGIEVVGQRLATAEPKSPMFEAKKALELKNNGKTVERLDHQLFRPDGSKLTDIDITYKDGSTTKYLETSTYNWNKANAKDITDLWEQLEKYIKYAGSDASKVKFASEQGITPAVKKVLDDLNIELI